MYRTTAVHMQGIRTTEEPFLFNLFIEQGWKNFDFQCHAVVLYTNWSKHSAKHDVFMWRKFMTCYWINSYTGNQILL